MCYKTSKHFEFLNAEKFLNSFQTTPTKLHLHRSRTTEQENMPRKLHTGHSSYALPPPALASAFQPHVMLTLIRNLT